MGNDTPAKPEDRALAKAPGTSVAPAKRMTLRGLFVQQKPELANLMPKGMDPDRLFRMTLTECQKQPRLYECTAESWAMAMQQCAAQGLYPDSSVGYMYLVARKNRKKGVYEVQAMRGYQGDIKLVRNTGELKDIYAEVVHKKDEFKVVKGLNRDLIHVPTEDEDPGELKAVYAVAKLVNGETAWVVLQKRDVERHKASSESADEDWSPWQKHTEEMWKKTAIHAIAKWLPKATEEFERAERIIMAKTVNPLAGEVALPEAPAEGLDGLTDRLEEEAAQLKGCDHEGSEEALRAVPVGSFWPCKRCGEDLPGTKPVEGAAVASPAKEAPAPEPAAKAVEKADPKTCTHAYVMGRLKQKPVGTIMICEACDSEVHKTPEMAEEQAKTPGRQARLVE